MNDVAYFLVVYGYIFLMFEEKKNNLFSNGCSSYIDNSRTLSNLPP
jgi:hypothetical protein